MRSFLLNVNFQVKRELHFSLQDAWLPFQVQLVTFVTDSFKVVQRLRVETYEDDT